MGPPGGPIAEYRRFWLPELMVLLALALASTILFSATRLDIDAARHFYHPEQADPWPVAARPLWSLFYRSAPWVTGFLAAIGGALLVAGSIRRKWSGFRLPGIFLFLCVILGPGLIVNGILKDHWGRPRPRQIVEFGGRLEYVQPLVPARTHGKSFPCGHCSVGYLYGAGWWIWRRSRPRLAAASLAAGTALGTLMGIGRLAAGGHFLSDTVWSGLIAFGVAHALYYYVLRIPAREDEHRTLYPRIERSPRARAWAIAASILLGAGIAGGGIVASPHYKDLAAGIRLTDYPVPPETIEVRADMLDVELFLTGGPAGGIECTGEIHGFGLPTNRIRAAWEYREKPAPSLRYVVSMKGWFPDMDGTARIRIPRDTVRKIAVRLSRGNITVVEEPGASAAAGRLPELDLHTDDGRILRLPPRR